MSLGLPTGFVFTLLALLGLIAGSAVSAVAFRLPRGLSWATGRSRCTSCGASLGVLDLVPLLSYVASRGRCRHCGAGVSPRYPVTEVVCAAWTVLLYLKTGPAPAFPLLALWGYVLVTLMWIDLDYQILPDELTLLGTLIGLGAAFTWPGGGHDALYGILLGSGVLWLLGWAYLKLRHIEGMGGGDVKLAAMFGAALGWKLTLVTLFLAALAGSAWGLALIARGRGSGQTALPFGALLAPAAMVACLWGAGWLEAYMSLFGRH
jgi:leader peptidase (prepilin peptidase)/N-methyltransferase